MFLLQSKLVPLSVICFLFVVCICTAVVYSHILPETIPSHWNSSNEADDTMNRTQALVTYCCIVFIVGLGMTFLSLIFRKLPIKFMNVPNKQKLIEGRYLVLEEIN